MKTICGRMPFSSTPNPSIIEQLIKKRGEEYQFFVVKIETRNERSSSTSFVLTIEATNDENEFSDLSKMYGVTFFKKNPDDSLTPFSQTT